MRTIKVPHTSDTSGLVAQRKLKSFIFAAKGAGMDCSLVVEDQLSIANDSAAYLLETLESPQGQKFLQALDFTTINPTLLNHTFKAAQYKYQIKLTRIQARCVAAVILHNPAASHLVAVIPRCDLVQRVTSANWKKDAHRREAPLFELGAYRGSIHTTGYISQAALVQKPRETSSQPDYALVHSIWSAFTLYSQRYTIERLTTSRLVGDFQIVHKASGVRATVEVKHSSRGISIMVVWARVSSSCYSPTIYGEADGFMKEGSTEKMRTLIFPRPLCLGHVPITISPPASFFTEIR